MELLEININRELKFDKHALEVYSKAGRKVSALARMSKLILFGKRRALFKAFIKPTLNIPP